MPPREDLILFLDLETTGVDEEKDNIIEVGLSMLSTEPGYPEVGYYTHIIFPDDEAYERMVGKDVVWKMHRGNGLIDDLRSNEDMRKVFTVDNIDLDVVQWIDQFVKGDTTHIPLGGSGVLHFDRRFIKRYMPLLDKRLTHWAYDVGVLRRTFMKAGVKYASMDAKTHRALDDARVHADEWRYYQDVIGGLERV